MMSRVVLLVGVPAGIAFSLVWVFDPGAQAILIVSLVCGLSGIFSQFAIRALIGDSRKLVEQGADEFLSDGGQQLVESQALQKRVHRFAVTILIVGVLSPASAAARVVISHPFFSAAAISLAVAAIILALLLFKASISLSARVVRMRRKRAEDDAKADAIRRRVDGSDESVDEDPNLKSLRSAGSTRIVSHS